MAASRIKINWSITASEHLSEIRENIIENYSIRRANEYVKGIVDKVKILQEHPEAYPPCRSQTLKSFGYRCFTYKKRQLVVFEFVNNEINIVGIVYAKMSEDSIKNIFG